MSLTEIKAAVNTLSTEERSELSKYLMKVEIENNQELWEEIRERTSNYAPSDSRLSSVDTLN